jgi:alanine racemase
MINLYDVLEAADGQLFGEPSSQIFSDFCFDSRRAEPGQLFVAMKTPSGDGHDFMQDAIKNGVTGLLCTRPPRFNTDDITVVVARDVENALLRWTALVLEKFGTSVIAVSGSAGKSTTKEAIARVLSTKYNVYKSPGSFNGRFGLPMALGKLEAEHQLAVLEFGIDQFGEMEDMVRATRPAVGVITNIGHSHLDRFGTIESVTKEEQVLLEQLPENGVAIINDDDPIVRQMQRLTRANKMTISVDISGARLGADLIAYNIVYSHNKTGFDLRFGDQRLVGRWIPLLGAHQVYAALHGVALGLCFDIPIEASLKALTDLEPLPGRMRPFEGVNGSQIIDDSYSATLESTMNALDWVANFHDESRSTGKIYTVLGDIGGLGSQSIHGYREVGKRAAQVTDWLVTKGEYTAELERSAQDNGVSRANMNITFSARDAAHAIKDKLQPGDIVLVKGNQASRMERIVKELLANPEDAALLPRQESAFEQVWIDRPPRPTWLQIDMDAVAYNVRRLKEIVGDDVDLMAVVKANAYGHGAVPVSTTAMLNGASYLGVASINEAMELRDAGIDAPILILGYTPAWAATLAIRYDVAVTLYDEEVARSFDRTAAEMNRRITAHIKVDTGMGRLGILPEETMQFFRVLNNVNHIDVEGIFTHFSVADEDRDYTLQQVETFNSILLPLQGGGYQFRYIHAANSAAVLTLPESRFNMVRVGIAMHGLHPSSAVMLPDDFIPALTWKTTIAQVKEMKPGSFVGYGNTYQVQDTEMIAVIPVGYADGFRRSPQTWGDVLVHGQRAPIVGRVSMDQTMINVTGIDDVKIGDEVIIVGKQGREQITAEEAAAQLGTVNYELVSTILARVPRVK